MASFTDTLSQFNPYVQQLPVQAMVEVGMEKQRRYDEGIQKIQTQVDEIAGLDIIKDVNRKYLQSKLDTLGSQLKMVAAGDFSNSQLVSSTTSMIGKIAKDPMVQSAYYSTQRVRKGQRDLEEAKQEGKSSVQNEDDWNFQVNSWLNDNNNSSRFNGEYIPYTDLSEKYAKVTKDLSDVENSYDQPYKTDSQGNTLYFTIDKNGEYAKDKSGNLIPASQGQGRPIVDDAMKSITTKGKSAQRILNNFYSSTTENDRRQLMIDAKYHYKGADVNTFKNDIVANYALQKRQLQEYSTEVSVMLKSPKISDKDKAVLQAKLTEINQTLSSGQLDQQMIDTLNELKDPSALDRYKVKVYTQKYLSNLAQDLSTESYKMEVKSNPYKQQENYAKQFLFDIQKENTRIAEKNRDYLRGTWEFDQRMDLEERKYDLDVDTKGGKRKPVVFPDTAVTDIDKPTINTITDRIFKTEQQLQQLDNDFLSVNDSKYTKASLDQLVSKFNEDPGSVDLGDNDLREYILSRRNLEREKMTDANLRKKAQQVTAYLDEELNQQFKAVPGLADKQGREAVTSKEMYDLYNTRNNFVTTEKRGGNIPDKITFDTEGFMKKYRGSRLEPIARAIANTAVSKGSAIENGINDRARYIYQRLNPAVGENHKKSIKAQQEFLMPHMPEYFSFKGTLSKENKGDMDMVDRILSDAKNPSLGTIDTRKKSDFDTEELTKWQQDPQIRSSLDHKIVKNYDGSGELIVQNGTIIQRVPLTVQAFSAYYPEYSQINPFTEIKKMIMASPENTTNPLGKEKANRAAYTGYELPLLKNTNLASRVRYDIEGPKRNNGGPNDGYQIRLYVKDDKGIWRNKVITRLGYISEDQVMDKISEIGLNAVKYVLNQ